MVVLKSDKDLEMMSSAGKILAKIMKQLHQFIVVGITTEEINQIAADLIRKENVKPAFLGYKGFPADTCISVNEEVVHGIPSERKLQEYDIVSIDLGINFEGYYSDSAFTVGVGKIDAKVRKLIDAARKALLEGIREARVNNHISDISYAIQRHVEARGFSVVRQFVGHGIGRELHEEPEVPNFGRPHEGSIIKSGMVLAIEPMVNMGSWECEISENGWTAVTKDRLPSAHFEHTVAITEKGPQVLTQYN